MSQTVGLTLGKFAPLHKGHQLVFDQALQEVEHLIVVIYNCPDTIRIPLNIRAAWIRQLYPAVEVLEAWDGPLETGDTPHIKKSQEEYILNLLNGRRVTHFYSSEFYGEHKSQALNAVDRRIDGQRQQVPVSGSLIRENPFQYRNQLDPLVYRELITNVVFLGGPSTGKTTIAERMAKEYNTVWMPEYGREYWDKHQVDRQLTLEQLVEIAEGHIEREERLLLEANRYLFTDTNAVTTYMFSMYYHGKTHPRLVELADQCMDRYAMVFLCDTDIPYDDTWDRSGEVNRTEFQEKIVNDLVDRQIQYHTLHGTLPERALAVKEFLAAQS